VIAELQGEKLRASETATTVIRTSLAATSGKPVVVSAGATESEGTRELEIVTLTAKILKP
jgi:hypothetical protein